MLNTIFQKNFQSFWSEFLYETKFKRIEKLWQIVMAASSLFGYVGRTLHGHSLGRQMGLWGVWHTEIKHYNSTAIIVVFLCWILTTIFENTDTIAVNSVNRSIGSWKNCHNFVFDNKGYSGPKYGFHFNGFKIYMKFPAPSTAAKSLPNNTYSLLTMSKLGGKLGLFSSFP